MIKYNLCQLDLSASFIVRELKYEFVCERPNSREWNNMTPFRLKVKNNRVNFNKIVLSIKIQGLDADRDFCGVTSWAISSWFETKSKHFNRIGKGYFYPWTLWLCLVPFIPWFFAMAYQIVREFFPRNPAFDWVLRSYFSLGYVMNTEFRMILQVNLD